MLLSVAEKLLCWCLVKNNKVETRGARVVLNKRIETRGARVVLYNKKLRRILDKTVSRETDDCCAILSSIENASPIKVERVEALSLTNISLKS